VANRLHLYNAAILSARIVHIIASILFLQSKPGEVQAAVKTAVEAGCRLIDCAYAYCNEGEVGQALKEVIDQGTVKREDLFIISKVNIDA
jgi:diketogulonate reductase-like aldo/keto reductase